MRLNDYQEKADEYRKVDADNVAYFALGLCGEAGEFAEKVKKAIRDGTWDPSLAAQELGDTLWYLSMAAKLIGFSLEEIAQMNLDKLGSRAARGVLKGSGDQR